MTHYAYDLSYLSPAAGHQYIDDPKASGDHNSPQASVPDQSYSLSRAQDLVGSAPYTPPTEAIDVISDHSSANLTVTHIYTPIPRPTTNTTSHPPSKRTAKPASFAAYIPLLTPSDSTRPTPSVLQSFSSWTPPRPNTIYHSTMLRYRLHPHQPHSTRPPIPLIHPSILTHSPSLQPQSSLLTLLPLEILHRILLDSDVRAPITKLFISLSCKLLATTLAQAKASSPSSATHGALLRTSVPKPISKDSPTAQITMRTRFMHNLKKWIKEDDGWVLCSVCLVFKRRNQGSGVGGEWRSLKRGADKNVRRAERRSGSGVAKCEGDGKGDGKSDEEEDDGDLWVCPKHRVEASRMVQLRDR